MGLCVLTPGAGAQCLPPGAPDRLFYPERILGLRSHQLSLHCGVHGCTWGKCQPYQERPRTDRAVRPGHRPRPVFALALTTSLTFAWAASPTGSKGSAVTYLLRACALEASHPCSAGQPRSGAKQWELCRCPWVREAQDATWCGRKGVGGRPQSQCEMLRGAERQAVSLCASTVPRDNAPRGDLVFSTCSYTRQWAVRVSNIL